MSRIKPPSCSLCCKACVECCPCWLVLRYHIKFSVGPSVGNAHCFDCVLKADSRALMLSHTVVTCWSLMGQLILYTTNQPTNQPTQPNPTQPNQPTNQPTNQLTNQPTNQPTQSYHQHPSTKWLTSSKAAASKSLSDWPGTIQPKSAKCPLLGWVAIRMRLAKSVTRRVGYYISAKSICYFKDLSNRYTQVNWDSVDFHESYLRVVQINFI